MNEKNGTTKATFFINPSQGKEKKPYSKKQDFLIEQKMVSNLLTTSSSSFSTVQHRDSPATLKTPLIRKFLVTHWCLSTFLGSSVSLVQTPHLTRLFNFHTYLVYNLPLPIANILFARLKKNGKNLPLS